MRRLAAVAMGLALLAVACDGEPAVPGGGEEGQGDAAAPSADVRIGLLYTISGQGQEFAQAALGAATLAVSEAERRGVNVELVDRDYGGNPDRARAIAEELALEGVTGIVVGSDDPAVGPALEGFGGVPLVHALLPADAAVRAETPTFRVAPSTSLQAEKLAAFLVGERGDDRVAILHEASPFGEEGGDELVRALSSEGAEVVLRERFRTGGDIHTPVTHAGQLEADSLALWTRDPAEAGRVTIEIHEAGQAYQLALAGSVATFSYGKNASSQVTPVAFREGILSVGTWAGPWFDLDRLTSFFERFREANNADAPYQALQIHDAVLLLADAGLRAGSGDPDEVAVALEDTEAFVGAGVPMSFSPEDHEGVGPEDMAILAFTKDPEAAGGEFAPDVSTGGGFFTIDARSVELPPDLLYLLEGLAA